MHVTWGAQKFATHLLHLLQGLPSMINTSTTSQTILLWVYSKPKPWNNQVQGPGVHHVVVGVAGRLLGRYQGFVTTYYNAAFSDLLS